MLHFDEKFSPRQRFWLGFACCPFIIWTFLAVVILLAPYSDRILARLLVHSSALITGFLLLSGLLFLSAMHLLAGFCAASFWRHLIPIPNQEMVGLWSILVSCFVAAVAWVVAVGFIRLPAMLEFCNVVSTRLPILQSPNILWFAGLFVVSVFHYCVGLWRGNSFRDSNRLRQWFGDFSDMS